MIRIHHIITALVLVLLATPVACTNRNYTDLMRVTSETDAAIMGSEAIYTGNAPLSDRIHARDRIMNLRKKQMIMAQRINVSTMPDVQSGKITAKEGEARKAELVAAATKRYEDAVKLPVPTH